jgi:hypothetical protein
MAVESWRLNMAIPINAIIRPAWRITDSGVIMWRRLAWRRMSAGSAGAGEKARISRGVGYQYCLPEIGGASSRYDK